MQGGGWGAGRQLPGPLLPDGASSTQRKASVFLRSVQGAPPSGGLTAVQKGWVSLRLQCHCSSRTGVRARVDPGAWHPAGSPSIAHPCSAGISLTPGSLPRVPSGDAGPGRLLCTDHQHPRDRRLGGQTACWSCGVGGPQAHVSRTCTLGRAREAGARRGAPCREQAVGGFAVGFGTDAQRPSPRHWSLLGSASVTSARKGGAGEPGQAGRNGRCPHRRVPSSRARFTGQGSRG